MATYIAIKNLYTEPAKMLKPGDTLPGGLELDYDSLISSNVLTLAPEPVKQEVKAKATKA